MNDQIKQRLAECLDCSPLARSAHSYGGLMDLLRDVRRVIEELEYSTQQRCDHIANLEYALTQRDEQLRKALGELEAANQRIEELEGQKAEALHNHLHAINPLVGKLTRERDEAFDKGIGSVLSVRCIKHIGVPQQNKNEHSGGECGGCIAEQRDQLESQLREREAQCALKHEAILQTKSYFTSVLNPENYAALCKTLDKALSTDAGKAMLERLQAVEKERNRMNEVLNFVKQFLPVCGPGGYYHEGRMAIDSVAKIDPYKALPTGDPDSPITGEPEALHPNPEKAQ